MSTSENLKTSDLTVRRQLASFLPSDRCSALARGHELPEHDEGAILFSDISGFVGLTAALAEHYGARGGGDRIAEQLNSVFEDLIAVVHRHGGAVIGFSGDAITCFFRSDTGGHATSAALRMRHLLAERPTLRIGEAEVRLKLKSAVTAGRVSRFVAGDPGIQSIDVVTGEAVHLNALAAQRMAAGQVVVDPEVYRALGTTVEIEPQDNEQLDPFVSILGLSREPPPAANRSADLPTLAQLQPWILSGVRERLQSVSDGYFAELRPISVLFLSFTGIDFNRDHRAAQRFDAVVRAVQTSVGRHGGAVVQVSTGEKGDYLCAVFGTPESHGDEPRRALNTAFEIYQAGIAEAGAIQLAIGIGHGSAWCGAYGAHARRTFGVHGRQVNLAARLMQRAEPGQILLSDEMVQSLRGDVRTECLGTIRLKGETAECQVHAAREMLSFTQRRAAMLARPNLVGRDAEKAAVSALVEDLAQARGGRLVILGEAGIGKSSLLEHLLGCAEDRALRVALGAGEAIRENTSFGIWHPVLSALAGLNESETDGLAQWVKARLETRPALLAKAGLLNEIMPLDLGLAEVEQLSPEARHDGILESICGLVELASLDRPTLLVIEDAHWLDEASWTLLARLDALKVPLGLVIASRPFHKRTPTALKNLCSRVPERVFSLAPLEDSAIAKLLRACLGVVSVPPVVEQLVRERAQGHPYFSEELCFALRDLGFVVVRAGILEVPGGPERLTTLDLPATVEGVVQARMDRLDLEEQFTLKVASVIGRVFGFGTLCDVHPRHTNETEIRRQLDHLSGLEITPIESPEPRLAFFFRHLITQEVAYARMTRAQREPIHRAMAQWLEARPASIQTELTALAHHWEHAGDSERALGYLELATDKAIGTASFGDALNLAKRLLKLGDGKADCARRARWHERLSNAAFGLGQTDQAYEAAARAIALIRQPFPPPGPARRRAMLRELLSLVLQQLALTLGRQLVSTDSESCQIATRLYARLAETSFYREDPAGNLLAEMGHLIVAERLGPSIELLRALASTAVICQLLRLGRLRKRFERRALELESRFEGNAQDDLRYFGLRMMAQLGDGDLDTIARIGKTMLMQVDAVENRLELVRLLPAYRILLSFRGDHLQALEVVKTFESFVDGMTDREDLIHELRTAVTYHRALSWMYLGQPERAQQDLAWIESVPPESLGAQRRVWVYTTLGLKALEEQNWAGARSWVAQLKPLLPTGRPFAVMLLDAYALELQVELSCGEHCGIGAINKRGLRDGFRWLRAFARTFPPGRARMALMQGRYWHLRQRPRRAQRTLREGVKWAKQCGMYHDLAYLHLALARCDPAGGAARRHWAARAQENFATIGNAREVAKAVALAHQ